MKSNSARLILLAAAGTLAGCPLDGVATQSPTRAQVSTIQSAFNKGLGDEGTPVSREEVRGVFEEDPELLAAVLESLSGDAASPQDGEQAAADESE